MFPMGGTQSQNPAAAQDVLQWLKDGVPSSQLPQGLTHSFLD